jgi:hypothetical protein
MTLATTFYHDYNIFKATPRHRKRSPHEHLAVAIPYILMVSFEVKFEVKAILILTFTRKLFLGG